MVSCFLFILLLGTANKHCRPINRNKFVLPCVYAVKEKQMKKFPQDDYGQRTRDKFANLKRGKTNVVKMLSTVK